MSDDTPHPQLSDKGRTEAERRQRRQADALRANLSRRKAQSRARVEDVKPEDTDSAAPPEG